MPRSPRHAPSAFRVLPPSALAGVAQNPRIFRRLKQLVESSTRGDPMSPLLWTCQRTQQLATILSQEGNPISPDTIGRLLAEMGYSLQANLKTLEEGANHPDRAIGTSSFII
jgi:hypothetical protein